MMKDWDRYKAEIRSLYIVQQKTLHEVRRLLKGRHGFNASTRAYRMKFEIWGFRKNRTDREQEDTTDATPTAENVIHEHPEVYASELIPEVGTLSRAPPSSLDLNIQNHNPDHWAGPSFVLTDDGRNVGDTNFAGLSRMEISRPPLYERRQEMTSTYQSEEEKLYIAIRDGNEIEVNHLLSAGVPVNTYIHFVNPLLHEAIITENVPIIKALLRYGANINTAGYYRKTPLHLAVFSSEILLLLLKSQPVLSSQDQDGNTALHLLLLSEDLYRHKDIVSNIRKLLSLGADINILNSAGKSPLYLMISHIECVEDGSVRHLSLLLEFLDHTPNIHLPTPNRLHMFAIILVKLQPILNSSSERRYHRGRYTDRRTSERECIKRFLLLGADPNTIVHQEKPLLHYCLEERIFRNFGSDLLMLIFKLADVNLVGPDGNNSLHLLLLSFVSDNLYSWYPSKYSKLELLNVLIERGVDVNRLNMVGAGPVELLLCNKQDDGKHLPYVSSILRRMPVILRLTSNGESIFDLVERFSPESERFDLTKALLESDLDSLQPGTEDVEGYPQWVLRWRKASRELTWIAAKHLIEFEDSELKPKSKLLLECAFIVIAERLLRLHKRNLVERQAGRSEKDSARVNRQEYIAILKDCNERRAKIDPSWYTYLLQLMDFD